MAARKHRSKHTPSAGIPARRAVGQPIRRTGVTLLELILALSLSVILLFAVGMALRLYWRSFDVKRTNVEQAHLARAVLRKIEDDLRSAIQYTPVDLSGLESMANASSLAGALAGITSPGTPGATPSGGAAGGSGGSGGSAGGSTPMGNSAGGSSPVPSSTGQGGAGAAANSGTSQSGTASSGGTAASGQAATADPAAAEAAEETPPPVIGLYGSSTQIQFDVSRLPRVDEYGNGSPTSMVQIPSDIKTITYYVRGETAEGSGTVSTFGSGGSGSTSPGSSEPSASGQGRGLMRLEMDRAVSAFGQTSGAASSDYDSAKLLASEVTSIAFRYWDGTDWVSDWNSDEMGGLPLAVEIVMTMADANATTTPTGTSTQNSATSGGISADPSYRIVVSLPTASLPPPVEEPAETETTTTTTATGATGGTGSSSTQGAGGAAGSSGAARSSGSSTSGSSSGGSSTYGTGSKTGGS